MAHSTLPHFEHHKREMLRTRRRFGGLLLVLMVGLSVALGLQFRSSQAAGRIVSGRVYDSRTGAGLANVQLILCLGQTAVTNGSGSWSSSLTTSDDEFCVRYNTGAPGGWSGPVAVNNRSNIGQTASYEFQKAGVYCGATPTPSGCITQQPQYDRSVDTGYDLVFTSPATPAPTPPPPPPATPVPATPKPATPRPATPKPAATPTPAKVATNTNPAPAATPAPAASTPATPGAPTSFQALAASDNALVSLSWTPPTDSSGVTAYKLERSVDQITWTTLADSLTESSYQDNGAAFGVHYYYRVRSVNSVGATSEVVLADAVTPNFQGNISADTSTSFSSDDNLSIATLDNDTVDGAANCSITADQHKLTVAASRKVLAGPYLLVCKDASGSIITSYKKPIKWAYNLKDKLKGYTSPEAVAVDGSGKMVTIKGGLLDEKTFIFKFTSAQAGATAVLGSAQSGFPFGIILTVVVLLALVIGVVVFLLRRRQTRSYDDYLRSKYYNL